MKEPSRRYLSAEELRDAVTRYPRGEDTGDEYLGIGMTDALISRFSSVRRFVVSPTK